MTSNPFSPPLARVEDLPDDASSIQPRRPLSVWTFQVIAALGTCLVALVAFENALRLVAAGMTHTSYASSQWGRLGIQLFLVAFLSATIVGSQRRKRAARWAGLACIAVVLVALAWAIEGMMTMPRASGDADHRVVIAMVHLLLAASTLVPAAFWFWAFGFSAKARAWFVQRAVPRASAP
jgi:hypothetical protein